MAADFRIRPEMTMDAIMAEMPEVIPVLIKYRVLCIGCLLTPFHDVSDAAREHGIDEQELLGALQLAVTSNRG